MVSSREESEGSPVYGEMVKLTELFNKTCSVKRAWSLALVRSAEGVVTALKMYLKSCLDTNRRPNFPIIFHVRKKLSIFYKCHKDSLTP